jgi:quercetin dioxygenase-like cupin family protein
MNKTMKLLALVLLLGAVARAEGDKPPSTEDALVADVATAKWKAASKPVPSEVQVSPIAVNPETKASIAYAKFPAGFKFPLHWHSHAEYSVFVSGKGTFILDGTPHEMTVGSYIVIPAKSKHELHCGAEAECIVLTRRAGPTDYHFVTPE